jgi:hypothetical protein
MLRSNRPKQHLELGCVRDTAAMNSYLYPLWVKDNILAGCGIPGIRALYRVRGRLLGVWKRA